MFYLPKSGIFLFHLTPAFILIFANIVFLKMIFDKKIFLQNKFYNFYSLFAFCFVNIFFDSSLSIAKQEDKTPECVYFIFSISKIACI